MSFYKEVSEKELDSIITTRKPRGVFWGKSKENLYIAVDNCTGDAWTENFNNWEGCKRYLEESQPIQTFSDY